MVGKNQNEGDTLEGVRIGNEKLIRISESANAKLSELIQRESGGGALADKNCWWGL